MALSLQQYLQNQRAKQSSSYVAPKPTPYPPAPASVYQAPKPVPTPWNPRPTYAAESVQGVSSYAAPQGLLPSSQYNPQTPVARPVGAQVAPATNVNTPPSGIDTSNIDQNTNTGLDIIDREYQDFLSQMDVAGQDLQGQAGVGLGSIDNSLVSQKNALAAEEATKLSGLNSQTATAQSQEKSALQTNRDMFRQIQQENIAKLSGLGISSSSVTEALAENLGVETARRIASTVQSANDVYQKIAEEKANAQNYVKNKITEIEGNAADARKTINEQLLAGMRQINSAKATAAVEKANQRAALLQNAQDAIYNLQQKAQEFAQSLKMWQEEKNTALTRAGSVDYSQIIPNAQKQLGQLTSALPNYSISGSIDPNTGYMRTINYSPKKDEEEDLF